MGKKYIELGLCFLLLCVVACGGPPTVLSEKDKQLREQLTKVVIQKFATPEGQPAPKGKSQAFGTKGWTQVGPWGEIWSPMFKEDAASDKWEKPTPQSKPVPAKEKGCYWYPTPWGWIWSPVAPDEAAKTKTTKTTTKTTTGTVSATDFSLDKTTIEVGTSGSKIAQEAEVVISGGSGKFELIMSDADKAKVSAVLESTGKISRIKITGRAVYGATITVKDTVAKKDGTFAQKQIAVKVVPRSYANLNLKSVEKVVDFGDEQKQPAGLVAFDDALLSHNKGGDKSSNKAMLYKLDPQSGAVLQTITIDGATHNDWEDLAADKDYIYIADTGNDKGKSSSKIYRISKQAIRDAGGAPQISVSVDKEYALTIADMPTETTLKEREHDWDFEAFAVKDAQPLLLSTQWKTREESKIFTSQSGFSSDTLDMQVQESLSLNPGFTITGAEYDQANDTLFAVGYYLLEPEGFKTGIPYKTYFSFVKMSYLIVVEEFSQVKKMKCYELDVSASLERRGVSWGTFEKLTDKRVGYEFDAVALGDDGAVYLMNRDLSVEKGTGPQYRIQLPAGLHRLVFEEE